MFLILIHLCIIPNKGTTKTLHKVYFGGLGVEPRRSSTQMKRPTVRLPSVHTTCILLYDKVVVVNVCFSPPSLLKRKRLGGGQESMWYRQVMQHISITQLTP